MRLLILTPEYLESGGGIMTFYRALTPALKAHGISIRVLEGSAAHSVETKTVRTIGGVEVETLERTRLFRWFERFSKFEATPGLRRHLAASWALWEQSAYGEGCDVIEACDWGLLFVAPIFHATRPVIVQCHASIGQIADHDPIAGEETQNVLVRLLERSLLPFATRVQTYSHMNETFWRTESGRDVEMIRPAWQFPKIFETSSTGRGLVVGRLQRWKGPQSLCQALAQLGERAPTFDWVGKDTPWGMLATSTASHLSSAYPAVWSKFIRHHAPLDPAKVARWQAAALFNLVPSTWDVFNFTAVEALASGRPTIVSTGAGASELIQDGENGYLFKAGDAAELAAVIERILGERAARLNEIGSEGRATVKSVLAPSAIAHRRVAAYRAAIDQFQSAGPKLPTRWLHEILDPQNPMQGEGLAFLQHFGIRSVAGHLLQRAANKVTTAARGALLP